MLFFVSKLYSKSSCKGKHIAIFKKPDKTSRCKYRKMSLCFLQTSLSNNNNDDNNDKKNNHAEKDKNSKKYVTNQNEAPSAERKPPDRRQVYGVDENKERGNWTGRLDFLLSMLGYCVGLIKRCTSSFFNNLFLQLSCNYNLAQIMFESSGFQSQIIPIMAWTELYADYEFRSQLNTLVILLINIEAILV